MLVKDSQSWYGIGITLQKVICLDYSFSGDCNDFPIRILVDILPTNFDIFYHPTLAERFEFELKRREVEAVLYQAFPECDKYNFEID